VKLAGGGRGVYSAVGPGDEATLGAESVVSVRNGELDFLDANFQRQQAQLDLLKTAGQLDKVWQ